MTEEKINEARRLLENNVLNEPIDNIDIVWLNKDAYKDALALLSKPKDTAKLECRKCSECYNSDHHWIESFEDDEPILKCKHCEAKKSYDGEPECEMCGDGKVVPYEKPSLDKNGKEQTKPCPKCQKPAESEFIEKIRHNLKVHARHGDINKLGNYYSDLTRKLCDRLEAAEKEKINLHKWSEKWEKLAIERQQANADLKAENEQLIAALKEYGTHGKRSDAVMCERDKHSDYCCTCGLDQALKEQATDGDKYK